MLARTLILGAVLLWASPLWGQTAFEIDRSDSQVKVTVDKRPLLVYQAKENPFKPYVWKFFTPGGVNVLRDSPSDHLHHHALMFAVAADGINFWEERTGPGMERNVGLSDVQPAEVAGIQWAAWTQDLDWMPPESDAPLLRERRTLATAQVGEPKASLLAWITRLEVPAGKAKVTLSGSNYFGLGMRFLPSMDTGGQFRNADGQTGVDGTNGKTSKWCAYSASADGKPVTIAVFDAPTNPRHPATWFTMDKGFAYLSATLGLADQPLVIEAGHPLVLRYAVALWDGQPAPEQIEKLYQQLADASRTVEQ
jgi:predicted secreted protein